MTVTDDLDEAARVLARGAVLVSATGRPSHTTAPTMPHTDHDAPAPAYLEQGLRTQALEFTVASLAQSHELHIRASSTVWRTLQVVTVAALAAIVMAGLALGCAIGLACQAW